MHVESVISGNLLIANIFFINNSWVPALINTVAMRSIIHSSIAGTAISPMEIRLN